MATSLFSFVVPAGYYQTCPISFCCERRIWAGFAARFELWFFRYSWHEMVTLLSRISDTDRSNNHHQHLEDLQARDAQTKCNYILIVFEKMGIWKAFDILRIIQPPLSLGLDKPGIELTKAFETPAIWHSSVSFPIRSEER